MIRVFFGKPGCGKTTFAVKQAVKQRKNREVYLNFAHSVPNSYVFDTQHLGEFTPVPNSYVGIDEAGIEYNNRSYKAMPKLTIKWFKLYRHYGVKTLDVFSQSWEDMDVTIRRLADQLWLMYRLGPFTLCRRIYKRITVDQETEQIIDGYRMSSLLWLLVWPLQLGFPFDQKFMLTFRPFYYKYFDTYDAPPLKAIPAELIQKKSKSKMEVD